MTRWDSPLFTVLDKDETPPFDQIWEAMVGSDGKTKVVRPNQATVLVRIMGAPINSSTDGCVETCHRAELPLRARQNHIRYRRPDHNIPEGPRRRRRRRDHRSGCGEAAGAPSNTNDTPSAAAHTAPIHHHESTAQLLKGPDEGSFRRLSQQRVPAITANTSAWCCVGLVLLNTAKLTLGGRRLDSAFFHSTGPSTKHF
jgi:hypothetical protein